MGDFMGSMFGAQIVADAIFFEGLSQERRHRDNLHQLAADNAFLRHEGSRLAQCHNNLAGRYNTLLRQAKDLERDFNQQTATIARQRAEKAADAAEIERLKFQLRDVTTELVLLRKIDKQQNPDLYPPE